MPGSPPRIGRAGLNQFQKRPTSAFERCSECSNTIWCGLARAFMLILWRSPRVSLATVRRWSIATHGNCPKVAVTNDAPDAAVPAGKLTGRPMHRSCQRSRCARYERGDWPAGRSLRDQCVFAAGWGLRPTLSTRGFVGFTAGLAFGVAEKKPALPVTPRAPGDRYTSLLRCRQTRRVHHWQPSNAQCRICRCCLGK